MVYEGNHKLGDLFASRREKGRPGLPTFSVTLTDGLVRRDSLERKTDTNLAEDEHLLVRRGDIAYNMMRMWQGASGLAEEDGIVSPAYVVLAPNENVDSRYAAYLFKSRRLIHLFWAYSYGLTSDRLRLYYNDFAKIPAEIPRLEEQTKIADILSTWDDAIDSAEKLISNSRAQKTALMQQLLSGRKRLAGCRNKWVDTHLCAIAEVTMGSSPASQAYNEGAQGLPLIQGNADIKNGMSKPRLYTTQITKECRQGDLLLSVRAPVGAVAISNHHACIGRGMAAIRSKEAFPNEYLYQLLSLYESRWTKLAQGSTFDSINGSDLRNLKFSIPSDPTEVKKIADILSCQDELIREYESYSLSLNREKKALMQQLLTGKRRVNLDSAA